MKTHFTIETFKIAYIYILTHIYTITHTCMNPMLKNKYLTNLQLSSVIKKMYNNWIGFIDKKLSL